MKKYKQEHMCYEMFVLNKCSNKMKMIHTNAIATQSNEKKFQQQQQQHKIRKDIV